MHVLQELQKKHFERDMKVIFWLNIQKKKLKIAKFRVKKTNQNKKSSLAVDKNLARNIFSMKQKWKFALRTSIRMKVK